MGWVHILSDKNLDEMLAYCECCEDIVKIRKSGGTIRCEKALLESWRKKEAKRYDNSKIAGFWVYIAINYSEDILYIGMTNSPYYRIKEHRTKSVWWNQAKRIEWRSCPNEENAIEFERNLILEFSPIFNIQGRA